MIDILPDENDEQVGERSPLPTSWAWVSLREIAGVNERDTALRNVADDTHVTFVPMAAVDAETGSIVAPQQRRLAEVRKGFTSFSEGDVLFAKITPCMENGKAAIAKGLLNGRGFGSTEFHVLRPKFGVLPEWLYFFIRQVSFREEAKASFSGTAGQLRVPGRFLEDYHVPLAPIAEQRRVVAKIEELFTQLDAGVASLKRIQTNLQRYKAAVLKAACEGKLVPQDASDEPASQLLERILAERRAKWEEELRAKGKDPKKAKYDEPSPPEIVGLAKLPEGWSWTTVEQLGAVGEQTVLTGPFGSNLGREDFISSGVPLLTIGCLTETGLSTEKAFYLSEGKANELATYRVRAGDLLFSRMASVGRAGLVPPRLAGAVINYHLMRLRLTNKAIDPNYFISYVRGAKAVADYIKRVNHGATRDGINTTQLLSLPVSLPPLTEQFRIVAEVERRLSMVQEQEAALDAVLKRAGRLRQAILRQALDGKLVPQDPADEPARVLLDNIRGQRAPQLQATAVSGSDRPFKSILPHGDEQQGDYVQAALPLGES